MLWLLACAGDALDSGVVADAAPPGDSATGLPGDTSGEAPTVADCGLTSTLTEVNYLEGDTVSFVVGCSGALSGELAAFTAVSIPEGANFDAETRTFTYATGAADGGRVDVVFAVLPAGDSEAVADTGVVTFWVADDPSNRFNEPVIAADYTEEWGLPVVHVNTTAALNGEAYAEGTVTWYGHEFPAGIQVHGKTSSSYPKLSYALKFAEEELPVAPWGITRDHLLLISTFDDNSYVRHKLTYDLWAAMADYWGQPRLTPRSMFTVLYLNGEYVGLYLGVDKLDDEWADHLGFERDANLYKAVDDDANLRLTDATGAAKVTLHQGYEKAEGEPADDWSDLDALVAFTGGSTDAELIAGSGSWFDLNEWMDGLALLFYVNGEDSYVKNVYMYHAPGELFRYAPWDFNSAWGQNWRTYRVSPTFEDDGPKLNRIFAAILDDPDASAWFWARFDQLRVLGPLHPDWQRERLDEYFAAIDPSAQRDWDKWETDYRLYGSWEPGRDAADDWTDYEAEKAYVYAWVEARAAHFAATR